MKNAVRQTPRLFIWAMFILGICIWYIPLKAAVLLAFAMVLLAILLGASAKEHRSVTFVYFLFIIFWAVGKFGLALYNEPGQIKMLPALIAAVDLASRLLAIAGMGISLILLFTPYQLAMEFGRTFKKIMPQHFWKLALALLLMLSFLKEARSIFQSLRQTISLRCPHLPVHRRILIFGMGLLRILSQQTWDRALAVAARKLDTPSAWD